MMNKMDGLYEQVENPFIKKSITVKDNQDNHKEVKVVRIINNNIYGS